MGNLFWVILLSAAMILSGVMAFVGLQADDYARAAFWMTLVILNSLSLDRIAREN